MKKILVIDDDKQLRDIYEKMSDNEKYSFTVVDCAEKAFELVESVSFDGVVLDIHMPGISGADLFTKIKEKYPEMKVIISSVFPVAEQKEKIASADSYYDKSQGVEGMRPLLDNILNEPAEESVNTEPQAEVRSEASSPNKNPKANIKAFFQDKNVWIAAAVILALILCVQFIYTHQLSRRVDELTEQAYLMGRGNSSPITPGAANTLSPRSSGMVFDPFAELQAFEKMFGQMLDDSWGGRGHSASRILNPRVNVEEKKGAYVVTLELPGIEKDNISIDIEEGILTVAAERNTENTEKKHGKYYHREVYSGVFQKSIRLPDDVDVNNIKADYENGVLSLRLNKKAAVRKKARSIPIKVNL